MVHFFGSLFFVIFILPAAWASAMPSLPCLGKSIPLEPSANNPYLELHFKFKEKNALEKGWFLFDTATNASYFDRITLSPPSTASQAEPLEFNFYRPLKGQVFRWDDFSSIQLPFRQIGIIGTDFISQHVYAIDFESRQLFESNFNSTCTPAELKASGFSPLSSLGYFSNDKKIHPLFKLEHIRPGKPNPEQLDVPNGPVVPIRIAGLNAVAMIDSGFNDRNQVFSVNINSALLAAVNKKEIHLLKSKEIPDSSLSTCVKGISMKVTAYRLKTGDSLEFITSEGQAIRTYSNATFFLKSVPEAASPCGGIGTWEIPAAQIGASFLKSFKTTVLNAQTQTVWIR